MRTRVLLVLLGVLLGLLAFAVPPLAPPAQCQQEVAKHGLRAEYYEWDPDLGTTPDRAEVFKPGNLRIVRLDPKVNFNWGTGQPDADVRADYFAVRWTGQVVPLYSEEYTFYASGDDGVRLWVSDRPINPNNPGDPITDDTGWSVHGETEYPSLEPIRLEAGRKYYIMLEMYEAGGGAVARLRWRSASQTRQIIPETQLIPAGVDMTDTAPPDAVTDLAVSQTGSDTAVLTWTAPSGSPVRYDVRCSLVPLTEDNWATARQVGPEPKPGSVGAKETYTVTGLDPIQEYYFAVRSLDANFNESALSNVVTGVTKGGDIGDGLTGRYYHWPSSLGGTPEREEVFKPENLKLTRVDPSINFGWASGVPATGIRSDYFAVQWAGMIRSPVSEDVTLYAAADDGVRLWVSENPIDPGGEWPLIDRWVLQAETEYASDPIRLEAGRKYYVIFEMYENTGDAAARLRWSSASIPKQIVPQTYLYSSDKTPRMGRLSGVVTDHEGKPMSRAGLTVVAGDRTLKFNADTTGFYTILLPEGTAKVTVTAQGFTVERPAVDVKADEITRLDIVIRTAPEVLFGDVNGDGKLGIPDATLALQIAVGILKNPTADQITAGDVNKNGKVDIADVTRILRAAVGLERLQ
ncbi:MAG: PA14 domain-containing protein [Armatimonadota bacterium]